MKLKNISIIIIVAIAALCIQTESAQTSYLEQVAIENQSISKKAGITTVVMNINLGNLKIDRNHLIVVTPVVASLSGDKKEELAPIIIKGTTRDKILSRPFQWKGKPTFDIQPFTQVVRRNATAQTIPYSSTLPYADWQRDAQLSLKTEVIGCADCKVGNEEKTIIGKILPDLFVPDYRFAYIVPEVEPVKERSEQYSAHLNYVVGRWDLLPNFENNAAELAKVDKSINALRADKDLKITDFAISGYASPEDTRERNLLLSQRRAETFAQYMEKKYGYNRNQFKVEWFGEDWNGLKKAVAASSLSNKDDILRIIDTTPDEDSRDALLIALDNGKTYNRLLNEFYPPLRRNDYNIAFIARAFDVNEAKNIIKTKPKLLSLNEMYLVANTYPQNSPEYNEVFRIASNTFPNDKTASLNGAVSELKSNNPDAALQRLEKIKDTPEAANLMGIAYAKKGDIARAMDLFNKARQQGNTQAIHNAEQLQLLLKDLE